MESLFFGGTQSLFRILIVGALAYVTLVVFLRLAGKRTLSKMNAFDLVVTVALGSTLATVLLTKDLALADGAVAFALLIGLQYVVTWSSVRVHWVRQLVTGEPSMLLHRGVLLSPALRRTRITEAEVRAAVRAAGVASLSEVEAAVLETDGSFSVIKQSAGDRSSLADVRAPERSTQANRDQG